MSSIVEIIIKATDEATAVFKGAQVDLEKVGKSMTDIGNRMTVGLTLPIVAGGAASVKSASDLADAMGKNKTVFGESAAAVDAWAGGLSISFGLSKTKALEYADTLGTMFGNMGIAKEESAGMSQGLTQLASDYAAFANVPIDQAFSALQSGLAGRGMELKKFGIDVSEAAAKDEALRMGLASTADELTEGDLAMARYSIMARGMAIVNGEWASSSGDVDVQMQNLKANAENAAATLGTNLLPLLTNLMIAANNLVTAFTNLTPFQQKMVIGFLGIVAAIGPLLSIAGSLLTVFGSLSTIFGAGGVLAGAGAAISAAILPVIVIIGALAAAVAVLYIGWKNNWFGIQQTVEMIIGTIKALISAFLLALKGDWEGALNVLKNQWDANWREIQRRFEGVKTTLSNIAKSVGRFIIDGLIGGIKNGASKLISAITGVVQDALDAAKAFLGISSPSSVFANIGQNMMSGMAMGIDQSVRMPVSSLARSTPALIGAASGSVNVNNYNNVANGLDIESLAYRTAEIIERKRRRR